MHVPPLVMVFIAVGLGAFGQIALKYGVGQVRQFGPPGLGAVGSVLRAVFTPYVFFGFVLYALSSLVWIFVLQQKELSYVYPLIAAGYVLVVILSWFFFNDQVGWLRLTGLLVICIGVVLVARS